MNVESRSGLVSYEGKAVSGWTNKAGKISLFLWPISEVSFIIDCKQGEGFQCGFETR